MKKLLVIVAALLSILACAPTANIAKNDTVDQVITKQYYTQPLPIKNETDCMTIEYYIMSEMVVDGKAMEFVGTVGPRESIEIDVPLGVICILLGVKHEGGMQYEPSLRCGEWTGDGEVAIICPEHNNI